MIIPILAQDISSTGSNKGNDAWLMIVKYFRSAFGPPVLYLDRYYDLEQTHILPVWVMGRYVHFF